MGLPLVVGASSAWAGGALPTNGKYVAGTGAISKKGANGLTVNQNGSTGIIDWSSFSIGKGNAVQFNNGAGATLNRVTGGDLSTIAGSLKATGSLYLINPQGVIVSGTGKVVTGGSFIASTRDESDSDFTSGKRKFSGTSNGTVTNAGTIKSANGDVTLIGNSVSNSGNMSAANGTASLNAGNQVLLAPAGSRILVSGGSGSASNSGTLQAAQAQINAAGGNVYALSGNNGGIVRATGTSTIGGRVWLTSGSGNVEVSGKVAATDADGSGGAVTARANNIVVSGNIDASATKSTKLGGNVSIIAADTTDFSGTIAARGGDHGRGGSVETSGQYLHVADSAKVDTLSTDGLAGDWLLDPNDFTIAASGGDITGAQLSTNLGTTDVTIASGDGATAGNGDIFVNDAVTWTSSHKLTINAQRNINVNANVTVAGHGSLALNDGLGGSGDLLFTLGSGHVAFTSVTNGNLTALFINGLNYRLETSIENLVADQGGGNVRLALADNMDASTEGVYSSSVIHTALQGTLEGLGNTISNITINETTSSGDPVGFLSRVNFTGAVKDLHLSNININVTATVSSAPVGGLVGFMSNGTVSNVMVDGVIQTTGPAQVGGFVGTLLNNATIQSSVADVALTSQGQAIMGGFAGSTNGVTIKNSSALGDVSSLTGGNVGIGIGGFVGDSSATLENDYASGTVSLGAGNIGYVGGFIGIQRAAGITSNSHATGTVDIVNNPNGIEVAGGFIGSNLGTIGDSYASGDVTGGLASGIGGFSGSNNGTIANSVATGNVIGGSNAKAGGFVASNNGTINNSSATGSVTADSGQTFVGGFAAVNSGTIEVASAVGSVVGGDGVGASFAPAGGFVGKNTGTISQAYATGTVTAGQLAYIGGFVGSNEGAGTIDEAYETGAAILQSGSVAGSFAGSNSGSLGNSTTVYFAVDAVPDIGSGNPIVRGGGLPRGDMQDYHNFDGWTFGTTPGASGWVIIDADGSLNSASSDGATAPMLLGEYSTKIATAHQLQLMELDPSAAYTLVADIDAGDTGPFAGVWGGNAFVPVGGNGNLSSFTGSLDGAGHRISNLTISSDFGSVGLFGDATGVIKDVGLFNANITGAGYVGALVGHADGAQISGAFVTGNILGTSGDIGGLVGLLGNGASISGSWSEVALGGVGDYSGGIAGVVDGVSSIDHTHADGSVQALGLAGGIAGQNDGTISFSYSAGAGILSINDYAGGIAGANTGTISNVYASQDVSSANPAGGLVGSNMGDVENSYWNTDAVFFGPISTFGADSGTSSNVSALSRADMGKTSSFSGWTFGALGSGADWVLIGADGAVNNPTDVEGGTLPMLLNEYSTTIVNAHQLQLMTLNLAQNYVLDNDVDASGTGHGIWGSDGFIAVGGNNFLDTPFSGSFDGTGHTIDRLGLADNANTYVGLFGALSADAVVSSVSLTNLGINHTSAGALPNNVGGIAGSSAGNISHVSVSGSITVDGVASVGGIAGFNSGDIVDAQTGFEIEVQNDADQGQGVGGVVGFNAGSVQSSSAAGDIYADGGASAGGLAGFNSADVNDPAYIISSDASANVTVGSNAAAGALVGTNDNFSWIESSFATGDVDGSALYAGGLVGLNFTSVITSSYATGNVTSFGDLAEVGGFAGRNHNSVIMESFATGNAIAVLPGGAAGGFVGVNEGSISDNYAMGSASADIAGGFVGQNSGSITNSYSLGIASGVQAGGFAGANNGTVANSFWDTDTSGLTADNPAGTAGQATAKTTAQAQQGLPTGFDNSTWAMGWGHTFAYLQWQFDSHDEPAGISGTVYSDRDGTSAGPGVSVSLADSNGSLGTVTTYADGSFYKIVANVPDAGVIASTGAGVTFSDAGNVFTDYSGIGVYDVGGLTIQTRDQNLSTLAANIDAATGLGTDFPQILSGFGTSDLTLETLGNDFAIDQALGVGVGTLTLNTHGDLSEMGAGFVAAQTLNGTADSDVTLNGANWISSLGTFTGGFSFALTNEQALTIDGDVNIRRTVDAVSSDESTFSLTTTGSGSDITIRSQLAADQLTLNSAGRLAETGAGAINAATLIGGSVNDTSLVTSNHIDALGSFTTTGVLSLTDAMSLAINDVVSTNGAILKTTGSGSNIAFNSAFRSNNGHTLTINSSGAITQSASSVITTATLTGSSVGDTSLIGSNLIGTITPFNVGGVFQFTNAQNFTTLDTINTNGAILKTVGAGHIVTFYAAFHSNNGHAMTVNSSGAISEGKAGYISASSFTATAAGAISLTGPNLISVLGNVTAGTGLSLTNAQNLTVSGVLNTGGTILKTTGAGHALTINGAINNSGHTVSLTSGGAIAQNSAGIISASTLTGGAVGAVTLASANQLTTLGSFNTGGGILTLTNAKSLTVTGAVTTGGTILKTTGSGHNITINAALNAGSHATTVASAGTITQGTAGVITASTLSGSSVGAAAFSAANRISSLGAFTASGNFSLTDAQALSVIGPLSATPSGAVISLTTTVGNLSFTGKVNGTTVTLKTAAQATQAAASSITTNKLNVTAKTGINLVGANHIKAIGTRTTTSGPNVIKGIGS